MSTTQQEAKSEWEALYASMTRTKQRIEGSIQKRKTTDIPLLDSYLGYTLSDCKALIESLSGFSHTVFDFFLPGVSSPSVKDPDLKKALERIAVIFPNNQLPWGKSRYSQEYVLKTLFQQVSIDLHYIQSAFDVRFTYRPTNQAGNLVASYLATLMLADALAKKSIAPAIKAGRFSTTANFAVLSYLGERVTIRILPHCHALLIRIPYTAFAETNIDTDKKPSLTSISNLFLTIPHEAGHVVFRNGRCDEQNKSTVQDYISKKIYDKFGNDEPVWLSVWREEIFADMYSCRIAGPISTIGLQEVLASNRPKYLNYAFGNHPVAALRPLMRTQMLRKLWPNYFTTAHKNDLDQQWAEKYAALRSSLSDDDPKTKGTVNGLKEATYYLAGHEPKGADILDKVDVVIDIVANFFEQWLPVEEGSEPWCKTGNPDEFLRFANNAINDLSVRAEPAVNFQHFINQLNALPIDEWVENERLDVVVEQFFFGWSDEGPDGEPEK